CRRRRRSVVGSTQAGSSARRPDLYSPSSLESTIGIHREIKEKTWFPDLSGLPVCILDSSELRSSDAAHRNPAGSKDPAYPAYVRSRSGPRTLLPPLLLPARFNLRQHELLDLRARQAQRRRFLGRAIEIPAVHEHPLYEPHPGGSASA